MTINYKRYFIVFFLILYIAIIVGSSSISAQTSESEALLDLSTHTESDEFYVELDGSWMFFEEELLSPDEVGEKLANGEGRTVSIPDSFASHTGDINSFGTYSTVVKIPERYIEETLAIHVPYQYSAYMLFAEQEEVARNGVVGENTAAHESEMSPVTGYLIPQSDEVLLTMQVSSFEHIRGGFENSILLGADNVVSQNFNTSMLLTLFINGCIFIIGLFMVLFALYRRKEALFLIFGLFAMLISVRALFAVPFYYTLILDMSWVWGTRLEYILTEATSMFFVILLWKWHENEFSKKLMYVLVSIHIGLMIATLFTQPVFFQTLFFNVFLLAVPVFFYMIYVTVKSLRNNNRNAKVNLVGMALIFLAFFNDYAIGQHWYDGVPLMLPAVGVYIVIHVLMMSRDFARSTQRIEQQNKELRTLNASNEQLAAELKEEIKQKDDFLANTSHELRNPLHGIINIAHSILRNRPEKVDQKTKDDLTLQLSIGNNMSRTLEDLLDITRLKEHRIQLQLQSLDIRSVSAGVMDMLKVLIENKNIQMEIQIPNDFHFVAADKNRLIQILFNLLHNAVKYTEEGSIIIDAETKNGMAYIYISDTGAGMGEETLHTIFEAYKQGDSSITAIGGGLGLGLRICRQLVEMHGGTIKANSSLGEGSTFTFTLPLAKDALTELSATTTMPLEEENLNFKETPSINLAVTDDFKKEVSSYRPKILAVDDDAVNLKVLLNILSEDQYEVATVGSGKEALEKLEWKEWDLIISDVMMPNMSGYELTRAVREKYSISELPILLLTARSNQQDIYTGFLAGANDYVTKPVDAVELNVRVQGLTDLQASINERLVMEAAWLHAQIRPHFLMNTLNAIISLSEMDTARMTRLLERFSDYLQSSFNLKNLDKVVPLQYELDLVASYLYIEKERFGKRLEVVWDLNEETEAGVPPLSIQTIVENAVNHGILQRMDGGTITIRTQKQAEFTEISIIDNGIGMEKEKVDEILTMQPDKKKGIGLLNTEQRLQRLYGNGLNIQSTPGAGTTVTITVPKRFE